MSNKLVQVSVPAAAAILFSFHAIAEQMPVDESVLLNGQRPIFMQIAELEQEKVLLQLEKEKAQIMLELDRMAAEQARIRGELDGTSSKAEAELRKLEAEREKLEAEREKLRNQAATREESPKPAAAPAPERAPAPTGVSERYRLIDIVGAGRQLQATLEDLRTGQKKKLWVGREIDGYMVRSISIDDGIVFEKDGEIETLGASVGRD